MALSGEGVQPLDRDVPALIVKVGSSPLHHGALGAIRSLGRAGVPVYAIVDDPHEPAARSRWLSGAFVWRNGGLGSDALVDGFLRIAERIGARPVAVPTDDRSAIVLAERAQALLPALRMPVQDPEVTRGVASKLVLAERCAALGLATPRVLLPSGREEALRFCSEAGFPVVAKVAEPWKGTPFGSTTILRSRGDAEALWDRLDERAGERVDILLQEYIAEGEDWIVHAYCDEDSTAVAAYSGVKLRSFPAFAGGTSFGVVRHNEILLDQARALAASIGYHGLLDMDWRLDRRDGLYKLLDFNPRLGAQFRLFVDENGLDVVRAEHLHLSGRPVPSGRAVEGRSFLLEYADLRAGLGPYRRAGLAPQEWYRSVRHVDETAWWSSDDMVPAGLFAAGLAARLSRRAGGRPRPGKGPRTTTSAQDRSPRFYPGRHH